MGSIQEHNKESSAQLVETITTLHAAISKLPDLRPSKDSNALFSALVLACITPVEPEFDVSDLPPDSQEMRSSLIELCSRAEGCLESHYSDILATHEHPLDHLPLFPYYRNYVKLAELEYKLLAASLSRPPSRVAFVGSGPLPLTTLILATEHMTAARFTNYDSDSRANERAMALVAPHPDVSARVSFRTADILDVAAEDLRGYDAVFLAALVGVGPEEKGRVLRHLARQMAPGAALVVRSARGGRAFLYPVVDPFRLPGFDVMSVYHPEDEVINSVIIAKKTATPLPAAHTKVHGGPMMIPCKCCEIQAFGPILEEMALEEQIS